MDKLTKLAIVEAQPLEDWSSHKHIKPSDLNPFK